MKSKFTVQYLEEAKRFIDNLDPKVRAKVLYNVNKAIAENDRELFKKLDDDIWEFRTLYQKIQVRLFAFWTRSGGEETLVIATHGIIKKKSKVDRKEIEKAKAIKKLYTKRNESS